MGAGPRLIALLEHDGPLEAATLAPDLCAVLAPVTVRMPTLAERRGDRLALARELMLVLAGKIGTDLPELDAGAAEWIEQYAWPGNLRQMRNVFLALLAGHRHQVSITAEEIEAGIDRFSGRTASDSSLSGQSLDLMVDRAVESGGFSLSALEKSAYRSALDHAGGNLSAAARLLGLSRAQLAYRVNAKDAE
jgi:transcriptional regulator with AAA-type ATPase domain